MLLWIFGIIPFNGVLLSKIPYLVLCSNLMDKRIMYQLLEFREIFITCTPLDGTSGYTTLTVVPSPKIIKILE